MKRERLFSVLVCLCCFLGVFAYDFMVDGIAYNFNDDGTSVTVTKEANSWSESNYANLSGTLQIPPKVAYNGTEYDVTRIGDSAFSGCTGITELVLPNSILAIDDSAFRDCAGITGNLVIPNSVRIINSSAFRGCTGVTKLYLGENLKIISNSMSFGDLKNLTEVHIARSIPPFKYDNAFSFKIYMIDGVEIEADDLRCYFVYDNCTLYVPKGSKQYYMYSSGDWCLFSTIIEEDESGKPVYQYDVDGSGIVDVDDVNRVVNRILDLE